MQDRASFLNDDTGISAAVICEGQQNHPKTFSKRDRRCSYHYGFYRFFTPIKAGLILFPKEKRASPMTILTYDQAIRL